MNDSFLSHEYWGLLNQGWSEGGWIAGQINTDSQKCVFPLRSIDESNPQHVAI